MEECGILKDFLFTNDNEGRVLCQFLQDEITKRELLKQLEFSPAMQKVIKKKKLPQKEIKEAFLDKLVLQLTNLTEKN